MIHLELLAPYHIGYDSSSVHEKADRTCNDHQPTHLHHPFPWDSPRRNEAQLNLGFLIEGQAYGSENT